MENRTSEKNDAGAWAGKISFRKIPKMKFKLSDIFHGYDFIHQKIDFIHLSLFFPRLLYMIGCKIIINIYIICT